MYVKLSCKVLFCSNIVTILNSICGKVMFYTCLSVIQFTGGWVGGCGRNPPGRHPLGRHLPRQNSPQQTPRDGHCSGRYASYWNVFLLNLEMFCSVADPEFPREAVRPQGRRVIHLSFAQIFLKTAFKSRK